MRLRHEWKDGATILTAKLATCPHCGALRVVEPTGTHYQVPATSVRDDRIFYGEPPCVPRPRRGTLSAW